MYYLGTWTLKPYRTLRGPLKGTPFWVHGPLGRLPWSEGFWLSALCVPMRCLFREGRPENLKSMYYELRVYRV